MKTSYSKLKFALGLLALAILVAPLTVNAQEAPKGKLSKAKEKYDADHDGKLSDEENASAKEGAKAKAKETREENLKKNLARYDANGNGKLDPEEREKMKADENADKEARKAARESRKGGKDGGK
jgi:Ca2+-binding EF-hand superfamily protein